CTNGRLPSNSGALCISSLSRCADFLIVANWFSSFGEYANDSQTRNRTVQTLVRAFAVPSNDLISWVVDFRPQRFHSSSVALMTFSVRIVSLEQYGIFT